MKAYFLWLAKFITVLIVVFVFVPLLLAFSVVQLQGAGEEARRSSNLTSDKLVSVIELTGMIMDSKEVLQSLHREIGKDNVKGVVLRIDSPGGAVGPSQEIYEAVRKLKSKKPIVVSMGNMAASGGLYSALGASKVYAQPSTITGSIGVILQIPNFSKVAEKVGVEFITIKSGKLKDVGNSMRAMTPEEREFLDGTVKVVEEQFIKAVVDARQLEMSDVAKFADGRIILGNQAMEYGLIDEFGDVYEAGRAVFEILGDPLPDGEYPKLHYPEDKFEKFRKFFEGLVDLPFGVSHGGSLRLMYLMP